MCVCVGGGGGGGDLTKKKKKKKAKNDCRTELEDLLPERLQ